jgi:phosphoheptose isomerase
VAKTVLNLYEEVLTLRYPEQRDEAEENAVIDETFQATIDALEESRRQLPHAIVKAARTMALSLSRGGKILVCGNGGSAAESQHFAAELVGRFRDADRSALPVLSLNADTAVLTAWANDVSFEEVFARQIEAFGRSNDVLVGLSTSGHSRNLIRAFETARRRGLTCIGILGGNGGDLRDLADVSVVAPISDTQRIQEVHSLIVHVLCELIESRLLARIAPEQAMPVGFSKDELIEAEGVAER